MNTIYLFLAVIFAIGLASLGIFLFLTRPGKNIVRTILFNKRYVVCHLINKQTGFEELWRVVPNSDFITKVGKYDYNLNPAYKILSWKGRAHYRLNEADVIPEYLQRKDTNEEVLIQVSEVKTALHNNAYKIIYGKKADLALILCAVALFVSIIVALYATYTIGNISPMIEYLYAHPPGNGNVTIINP